MTTYDIDPGTIAAVDRDMAGVSHDLDVLLASYNVHRGNADATVAYTVLVDNMLSVLDLDLACKVLALAVQRLAASVGSVGGTTTSSEEQH